MANLNKVLLIGNLTKDPELRYTPQGTAVVNLRMAVNRRFRNKNQELKEEQKRATSIYIKEAPVSLKVDFNLEAGKIIPDRNAMLSKFEQSAYNSWGKAPQKKQ
jgi:hypothetical protein